MSLKDIIGGPEIKLTAATALVLALVSACRPSPQVVPENLAPTPAFGVQKCMNELLAPTSEINRARCELEQTLGIPISYVSGQVKNIYKPEEDPFIHWFFIDKNKSETNQHVWLNLSKMAEYYKGFPGNDCLTMDDINRYFNFMKYPQPGNLLLPTYCNFENLDKLKRAKGKLIGFTSSEKVTKDSVLSWFDLPLFYTPAAIYLDK